MYTEIDWDDMVEFFSLRGSYNTWIQKGWKEIQFVRVREDRNLFISVPSTFTEDGQRECGKDAIRCLLVRLDTLRLVWQLKPTRREENWKRYLGIRLERLERLLELAGLCPNCAGFM